MQAFGAPPPKSRGEPESHKDTPEVEGKLAEVKPSNNGAPKTETPKEDAAESLPEFGSEPAPEKPAEAKAATDDKPPGDIKGLRAAYEAKATALKAKDAEISQWKAKAQEYEAKLKDSSLNSDEVKTWKERAEKAETELRYADYTKSGEFKEKYVAPIESARSELFKDLKEFKLTDEDGNEREATPADFAPLLNMGNIEAAIKAKKMFGDVADHFLQHRRELLKLHEAQTKAVQDWSQNGAQKTAEAERQSKELQAKATAKFEAVLEQARSDKSGLFAKPSPDNPEATAQFAKDDKLVKTAFQLPGGDPIPEGLTADQAREWQATKVANVVARATSFGQIHLKYRQALKQAKEWESKYNELKGSEPGNLRGSTPSSDGNPGDIADPFNVEARMSKFANAGRR